MQAFDLCEELHIHPKFLVELQFYQIDKIYNIINYDII